MVEKRPLGCRPLVFPRGAIGTCLLMGWCRGAGRRNENFPRRDRNRGVTTCKSAGVLGPTFATGSSLSNKLTAAPLGANPHHTQSSSFCRHRNGYTRRRCLLVSIAVLEEMPAKAKRPLTVAREGFQDRSRPGFATPRAPCRRRTCRSARRRCTWRVGGRIPGRRGRWPAGLARPPGPDPAAPVRRRS